MLVSHSFNINSTLQPYAVRAFGQSKEAHEIYDFLVDKMSKLQVGCVATAV